MFLEYSIDRFFHIFIPWNSIPNSHGMSLVAAIVCENDERNSESEKF